MFELLDAELESRDAGGLEHERAGQILGQQTVDHVLDLVQLERHHHVQVVQLLLLLQLSAQT